MHTITGDMPYWLASIRMSALSPAKLRRWLEQFQDIKSLFLATEAQLQAAGLQPREIHAVKNPDWKAVAQDLKWSEQPNCYLVDLNHPAYPCLLRELNDAPAILYVRGRVDLLASPQIAIVGSRNPTPGGKELAEQFAYALAQAGLIVTSGMALGIDAASHKGALAAQSPTIAVNGTGLNHVYPRSHAQLAEAIAEQGALVSEFPLEAVAATHHFPRRNRLISGLSLGVLVVEAAIRSGSLITARFAAEQGREVFAMPGSIHNPLARGCHQLIQQGAKLIEKAEDILEELGAIRQLTPQPAARTQTRLAANQQALLEKIGYESTALDTIILRSGLTVGQVSSMLVALELSGYVQVVAGGYARTA